MNIDSEIQEALYSLADTAPDGARVRAALIDPPRGRRRVALASAAAAAVVLVTAGIAYGVSSSFGGGGEPVDQSVPADPTGGPTGTDCAGPAAVAGTLESVAGSELVLRTAPEEQATVTTSADTEITRLVEGGLGDVTNGTHVFVQGDGAADGNRVAADQISVLLEPVTLPDLPQDLPVPGWDGGSLDEWLAWLGHVNGTVTAVDDAGGGFTVTTRSGSEVQVTTSSTTTVRTQLSVGPEELVEGEFTLAVGSLGEDGTLAADTVQQDAFDHDIDHWIPHDWLPGDITDLLPDAAPPLDDWTEHWTEDWPDHGEEPPPGLFCDAMIAELWGAD